MSHKEISRLQLIERLIHDRGFRHRDAACLLGISIRQVKRLLSAYKRHGAEGLVSKRRGKASNNRLSADLVLSVESLLRSDYSDFGPTLAQEYLTEHHGLRISVESVRQLMIGLDLWTPNSRKKLDHLSRPRRDSFGELIQMDGSEHAWFEDRGPVCTLLVLIDDATSEVVAARFVASESTDSYFAVFRDYIESFGLPLSVYTDRHSVFCVNHKHPKQGNGLTEFGRAMQDLDIALIHAHSPQAKGRVERVNRTFQDRLIKALRVAQISTIESANFFLITYLKQHNARFKKPAKSKINLHRTVQHTEFELDIIFSKQKVRCVSKSQQISYKGNYYQLDCSALARIPKKILVCEDVEQNITLVNSGNSVPYSMVGSMRRFGTGKIIDAKQINEVCNKRLQALKQQQNTQWALNQTSEGALNHRVHQPA